MGVRRDMNHLFAFDRTRYYEYIVRGITTAAVEKYTIRSDSVIQCGKEGESHFIIHGTKQIVREAAHPSTQVQE